MKFAVIEYTSKTGEIWKHTDERPNYLCDPIKELDPTSFGCYVSALKGEHIPLMHLVHPTFAAKLTRKLIGRWPNYDISYLAQFDVLMVVHQMSNGHEITRLVQRIKKEYPRIKILGVPTQPYGLLKEYWEDHPLWLENFREFSESCDVFMTIVKSTTSYWKKMFPKSNVQYVPQPYPVQYASRFFRPRSAKKSIIFVAGVPGRDNIPKGLRVANKIQQELPDYTIHLAKLPDEERGFPTRDLKDTKYEILPFQPWREHLEYLSEVALVVNTDYTFTRGRVQMDAAVVGTPSIGANSDSQADLFPAFLGYPDQPEEGIARQGITLLTDESVYVETVNLAKEALAPYEYEPTAQRIVTLVNSL